VVALAGFIIFGARVMPEQRLVLFVDNQNMYKGARYGFFNPPVHFIDGQFDPMSMGKLICDRPPPGITRTLKQVRIYTGQPDATKDPKGYGASRRQYEHWRRRGAEVISRPLRYPPAYPNDKPEEKGIDVLLAIDFIAMAIDGQYDVGVIASTDTDLIPAIDFVIQHPGPCRPEVTAWSPHQHRNPRLSSRLQPIWCHWLKRADYELIADPTDYTL
jgi:uncharacterized LabA/DUF88 family protein